MNVKATHNSHLYGMQMPQYIIIKTTNYESQDYINFHDSLKRNTDLKKKKKLFKTGYSNDMVGYKNKTKNIKENNKTKILMEQDEKKKKDDKVFRKVFFLRISNYSATVVCISS